MKKSKITLGLMAGIFCFFILTGTSSAKDWIDSTLFSPKLFIENKGQFTLLLKDLKKLPSIEFAVNHANSKIFFSNNKIAYTLLKKTLDEKAFKEFQKEEGLGCTKPATPREIEREEKFKGKVFKINKEIVYMEWVGANPDCKIEPSEVADEYFNYGMTSDIREDINFARGYKKIVYKDIYKGVDIEYTFHPRTGIKYNIIAHPGADISQIKLKYSGAKSVSIDENKNVIIKTALGDITDHAPVTSYENGEPIASSFQLNGNVVSFNLPELIGTGKSQISNLKSDIIIDPWVTTTGPELDTAYEVAVDPAGNVFLYGDFNSEVKKYNSAGVAQWTFTSGPGYLYNATLIGGDLTVDPTGNSYCSGSECIRKLSPAGTSVWLYAPMRNITNIACCETGWRMVFDPVTNRLYGTGSNGQTKATWYNPATGVPMWLPNGFNACNIISGPCPSVCPNANGEFRHITRAPNGNFYGYTCVGDGSSATSVSTITGFDTSFVPIYRSCSVPASPYWTIPYQPTSPTYYVGCYYMANGIAASNCYIYIYTGDKVYQYDIYKPLQLGSGTIANGTALMNSGILADSQNNFYVGTQTGISVYSPSFSLITSAATSKPVYDMAFAPGNNIVACGIGFVGMFSGLVQTGTAITCPPPGPPPPMTATANHTNLTGCGTNNGMAWVTSITNGIGPYTYYWSNGGTNDTITSLAAGNYSCTITDASCPQETTYVYVTITGPTGPTSTKSFTPPSCFGGTNGSATINVTGGTPGYIYQWTPSISISATANNIAAGTYTVKATDANYCTTTQTIVVTQPTAVTATASSTVATCGSNTGSASATAGGGTPGYTYSWSPGGAITQTASSLSAGTYTVKVTDSHGCTKTASTVVTTNPFSINVPPDYYMCSEGSGSVMLTASGGTSYTWSPGATLDDSTIANPTASPFVTTTYVVTVSNGTCSDTAHVTVHIVPPPSKPTISQHGDTLTVPSGFAGYQWYFNGTPITGATDTFYVALQYGAYAIQITDSLGCTVISNSITASVNELANGSGIKIYPNPVGDQLTILSTKYTISSTEIYNVLGEIVYSDVLNSLPTRQAGKEKTINCKQFSNGVYIIQIGVGDRIYRTKLVKN